MPKKGKRSLSTWTVLILLILVIAVYGLLRPFRFKPLVFIEDTTLRAFSSMIYQVSSFSNHLRQYLKGVFYARTLTMENEALNMELRLNKVELAILENLAEENQRLRQLMKLNEMANYTVEFADLLYREGANPNNFAIKKGENHGIAINQAVVYPIELGSKKILFYQLLGRITEVLPHQSRVLSLMDERSQISVRNMRNQSLETARYNKGDEYLFINVPQGNTDFQVGDILLTSEFSTLPKGIVVGIVKDILPSTSLYKKITVVVPLSLMLITEVGVLR